MTEGDPRTNGYHNEPPRPRGILGGTPGGGTPGESFGDIVTGDAVVNYNELVWTDGDLPTIVATVNSGGQPG